VSEYKCVAGARHLASLAALETWDPDYLLQMDDDAWVDPTCIDELVRVLQTYPMIGLAMAAGVSVWDHALEHDLERVSTGAVCMMLSAKTYQDIQGYDPKTHCVDDRDLSIRVFLLGKEVVKVKNAKAHHVPHRTTKENGVLVNDGLGPIESRNYPFYIDYIVKKYASVGIEVKVTSNGRLRYVDGLVRRGVLPKSFKYNYADLDEAILAGSLIYKPAF
jgi:GT2 family glycosyltransferase